MALYYNRRGL